MYQCIRYPHPSHLAPLSDLSTQVKTRKLKSIPAVSPSGKQRLLRRSAEPLAPNQTPGRLRLQPGSGLSASPGRARLRSSPSSPGPGARGWPAGAGGCPPREISGDICHNRSTGCSGSSSCPGFPARTLPGNLSSPLLLRNLAGPPSPSASYTPGSGAGAQPCAEPDAALPALQDQAAPGGSRRRPAPPAPLCSSARSSPASGCQVPALQLAGPSPRPAPHPAEVPGCRRDQFAEL